MTLSMTRQRFVDELTKTLRETYPDVTPEIIRTELDSQLAGKAPTGIMGMFVADNLSKITIEDSAP